jgi:hypothetical protein
MKMGYLDKDGVLYFWQKIKNAFATKTDLDGKVDKVIGKGLSTNDYTTTEKNKLASIDDQARAIILPGNNTLAGFVNSTDTPGVVDAWGTNDSIAFSLVTANAAISGLNGKVDKVEGKGLSTNDYTTEEKNKLSAFGDASTYALKSDITSMYRYKGSVATVAALPSSGNTTGDVYNVEASGMNYAWDGTAWDSLGEIFQITPITNAEIDTIVAS